MPCVIRWSVCLVVCGLLGASAPVRSQGLTMMVLLLNSPRQWVEVTDENGRVHLGHFEADARVYEDGSVRGGAVLRLKGQEPYEFRFDQLLDVAIEGREVRALTLEVGIPSSAGWGADKGFGFIRDESGLEHFLKYDIQINAIRDGFEYKRFLFDAVGMLSLPR